ncbi:conserved hypothetical protein [Heliomicrobium modesticaldum Ice1]|uniref:DUF2680 domain-containing protein n=1 Tax=Heliobacterium modesticaldum (strain ATCC 51547 / Ice1) TaxID=498761 RepID=B0TDM2_HELMI|nr:YckD family protein [Heliomicrobium modesticaldum]ABZ85547.1 conserved hypothetical protein [Heliomicrobium modesticaldum Ice1]
MEKTWANLKNKWIIAGLAGTLILGAAGVASAALTTEQTNELTALRTQIHSLRKQMVQKYADYGQITPEQAKTITDQMDARFLTRLQQGFADRVPGQNCPMIDGSAAPGGLGKNSAAGQGFGKGAGRGPGARGAGQGLGIGGGQGFGAGR